MILLRRRRPLVRAAVVGGGAYMWGKNAAREQSQNDSQEERLSQLEQEQMAGEKGGMSSGPQSELTATLNELNSLHASGVLTDSEFEAAKKKLFAS